MYYPSGLFRAKARAALKGHWQAGLLVALVVNLPTLLMQGISAFTGNDIVTWLLNQQVTAALEGVRLDSLLAEKLPAYLTGTGFLVCRGLELLAWLVTPCLTLGMYQWLIGRLRNQENPVSTVLCRMNLFFKAIGLQLMIVLKIFLWTLPGIAATALCVWLMILTGNTAGLTLLSTYSLPFLLLSALIAVPGVIAALRYGLSEYVLAESPKTGVFACIRRSKELMRDQKKNLFSLMVSFLLWYLLEMLVSSFLSGILSYVFQMLAGLALSLYVSCSVGAFYLLLTSGADEMIRKFVKQRQAAGQPDSGTPSPDAEEAEKAEEAGKEEAEKPEDPEQPES